LARLAALGLVAGHPLHYSHPQVQPIADFERELERFGSASRTEARNDRPGATSKSTESAGVKTTSIVGGVAIRQAGRHAIALDVKPLR
jgi:hypothetical protein